MRMEFSLCVDDVAWSPLAYQEAMKTMKKGDIVTIFTPDDTHFEIALSAIEHGQKNKTKPRNDPDFKFQ